ncbi:MAG: hypothetical protein AAGJ18_06760 [Bacteroidota bacterium]
MNSATKLNPVQLHLLELFSKNMGEEELAAIKQLLAHYYQRKVQQEVDAFWTDKNFTLESWNEATRDVRLRSNHSK